MEVISVHPYQLAIMMTGVSSLAFVFGSIPSSNSLETVSMSFLNYKYKLFVHVVNSTDIFKLLLQIVEKRFRSNNLVSIKTFI